MPDPIVPHLYDPEWVTAWQVARERPWMAEDAVLLALGSLPVARLWQMTGSPEPDHALGRETVAEHVLHPDLLTPVEKARRFARGAVEHTSRVALLPTDVRTTRLVHPTVIALGGGRRGRGQTIAPHRFEVADWDNGLEVSTEAGHDPGPGGENVYRVVEWQRDHHVPRLRTNCRHAVDLFVHHDVADVPWPPLGWDELPPGHELRLVDDRRLRIAWGDGYWLEMPDGYDADVMRIAQLLPYSLGELNGIGEPRHPDLVSVEEHHALHGRRERVTHDDWLAGSGYVVPSAEFVHPAIVTAVQVREGWSQQATATRYVLNAGERGTWRVTARNGVYGLGARFGGGITTTSLDLVDRWIAAAFAGGLVAPVDWYDLPPGITVDLGRVRFRWADTQWAERDYTDVRPLLDVVQLMRYPVEEVLLGSALITPDERVARFGPDPGPRSTAFTRMVGAPVVGLTAAGAARGTEGWSIDLSREHAVIDSPGGRIEITRTPDGVIRVDAPEGSFRTDNAHAVDVWLVCTMTRPAVVERIAAVGEPPEPRAQPGGVRWDWSDGRWLTCALDDFPAVSAWMRLTEWGIGALRAALARTRA